MIQADSLPGQAIKAWSCNPSSVEANVRPPQIISQDNDDVPPCRLCESVIAMSFPPAGGCQEKRKARSKQQPILDC